MKNMTIDEQERRYLVNRLDMCGQWLAEATDHDPCFIRQVKSEYRSICKKLYPDMFKSAPTGKKRITFACLTLGCPAKKIKLIHPKVKTLTLKCTACGATSKYFFDNTKIIKTEHKPKVEQ